jgi:hypothetical protein
VLVAETIVFENVAGANTISCAKIETTSWAHIGSQKTCFIDKSTSMSTSISTPGYKINSAKDDTIAGFHAQNNKNLLYLPDSPHEQFPNLQVYSAYQSSVKEITAANFKNLKRLRGLFLQSNQIEKSAARRSAIWNLLNGFIWV